MAEIISIANFKGGVGKTTTTQNLGAGLAREGYKVLLVDSDPQSNLTQSFLPPLRKDFADTLHGFYERRESDKDFVIDLKDISRINENLFLIPGSPKLSTAVKEFTKGNTTAKLKRLIKPIEDNFDFIILDCPPQMQFLTINCLVASDYVIIPVLAETLPTLGVQGFIDSVNEYVIDEGENDSLRVLGILISQYNPNPILSRNLVGLMEGEFPGTVFKTRIRRNIAISEAQAEKLDVYSYSPESNGSKDYSALVSEFISMFKDG